MDDLAGDELLRTALHECAHLAVARHLGACGFITIAMLSGGPVRYAGRFQMFGELADDEWRLVALAGAMAECLVDDAGATATSVARRLADDCSLLSGVDRDLAAGYDRRHVEQCFALVRSLWPAIVSDARAFACERVGSARD